MRVNDSSFFSQVAYAKKILVLDLGFLGDTLHLLPALRIIREALPKAKLHVMASSHIAEILELAPWIDRILGYPRFPKRPPLWKDLPFCWKLRKEKYDLLINLNGSQRSSYLSALCGVPFRLGRLNERPFPLRQFCFTHYANTPYGTMHVAKQRCLALAQSGFPDIGCSYDVNVPEKALTKVSTLNLKDKGFIHISPFASMDSRSIPPEILAECLNRLHRSYPCLPHVLTCAPSARERNGIEHLLSLLDYTPHTIIKGDFSTLELTALIQQARLHLGADTGPMHLAALFETPTVICTRDDPNSIIEWIPSFPTFRFRIGQASLQGLQGLNVDAIMQDCQELLDTL